jgi:NADPH:quinone reductase-like Zn-dependent oxidoreductase
MSRTSLQYQIINQGGAINTVSVPYPTPGPNEICIRPRAVALNPLDWKRRAFGFMVESWPTVLGIDAAGIVDSVGKSVTHFRKGDEVFNLCGLNNRGGAFQEIITVPSHYVAMKPDNLTVEEASSLP